MKLFFPQLVGGIWSPVLVEEKQSSLAPIVGEMTEKLRFKLWRHGKVCATRIRLARLNLAGGTIQ